MDTAKLIFADREIEVNISLLMKIPYFEGLFNTSDSFEIKLPISAKYFPALIHEEELEIEEDDIEECLTLADYLSWDYAIYKVLKATSRIGIGGKKHLEFLCKYKSSPSNDIIKRNYRTATCLMSKLSKDNIIYLCKCYEHFELSAIVEAVRDWTILNEDFSIWGDISCLRYSLDDNTMSNLVSIPDCFGHTVVKNNIKKLKILSNIEIKLEYSGEIYDENRIVKKSYFDLVISVDKIVITARYYCDLIIVNEDDYHLYVTMNEGQTFTYNGVYDESSFSIYVYE